MQETYQIIVLGPGGVGKTRGTHALIDIMNSLGFKTSDVKAWSEDMVVTSNFVIHNIVIPENYFDGIKEGMNLVIKDMGGQFKYREMWERLALETDGIVCVIDTTRRNTLKQIPLMLPREALRKVPVRLIVNKADLYVEFARKAEQIGEAIYKILQDIINFGFLKYKVRYNGEKKFIYNDMEYRYGDIIPVFRMLQRDENGNINIKITDFEIVVAPAFSDILPNLSNHNANLFGREFMLQMFEVVYNWFNKNMENIISDDLIISAHFDAPPFISWGSDPQGYIPRVNEITKEMIITGVKNMLIEDKDLIDMTIKLIENGYNINPDPSKSFLFTSAELLKDDPSLSYKAINTAMLPYYFVLDMIEYNENNEENEDDYFI